MAQIILDSNNNLIQGDFDNATINNRTKFKTTTTDATTNVYAVPNGSATSAGFTVTNAADPTNASKLTIATNGSTDTQIISGVNGTGTYLPMSFYTNNALAMQVKTNGIINNVYSGATGIVPGYQYYRLNSTVAGANVSTAQNWLGVGATLASSTQYEFEGLLAMSKTAGTTSHTIGIGFGGTATINNIVYDALTSADVTYLRMSTLTYFIQTASNTSTTNPITNAGEYYVAFMKGTISVNAGGTLIPQYTLSAAPGGAYTTEIGSYFKIAPLGASGSNISIGSWA